MATFSGISAFLVSFVIVAASTPFIRRSALRWKLGDKPNGRKINTSLIPHLGGIGIGLGTLLSVSLVASYLANDGGQMTAWLSRALVPVGLLFVLGLTDDMTNLKARQKLAVQVLSALVLAVSGFELLVGVPALDTNLFFVVLITTFYLVGTSSAVNLIDGHDGLAAGLCAISALSFAGLAMIAGASTPAYLSLAIAGACVGFLLFNFPPGRIFMGDTGSMFLGIMLGLVACTVTALQPGVNTFVAVCFVLAVPMLDAWLAIARRLILRRPVFRADSQHVHHVLREFGFTPRQTLLILYAMQAVMATLGILVMLGLMVPLVVGIVFACVLFGAFIRVMVASRDVVSRERREPVATKFASPSLPSWEK